MPSQEDYLDSLLKKLEAGTEEITEPEEEAAGLDLTASAPDEIAEAAAALDETLPEFTEVAVESEPEPALADFDEDASLEAILSEYAEEAPIPEADLPEVTAETTTDVSEQLQPEDEPMALEEAGAEFEPGEAEVEAVTDEFSATDVESVETDSLLEDVVADLGQPEESVEMGSLLEDAVTDLGLTEEVTETEDALEDAVADLGLAEESAEMEALLEDAVADLGLTEEPVEMDALLEDAVADIGADEASDLEDILDSDDGLVPDDFQPTSDLDALSSMSEDDIEKLLSAGAEETEAPSDETEFPEDDVLGMLEDADDGDLQEIHQLLDRADNNEAVNEEIAALLQETPPEENLEEKLLAEDAETMDPKAVKAQEKEKRRQEKAAAKKAAKEAKAAARAAAKEAKAAAKGAKSKAAEVVPAPAADAQPSDGGLPKSDTQAPTADDLFDTSILDSIVSEADQAGAEDSVSAGSQKMPEGAGEEDSLGASDLFGEAAGDSNDLGFDMNSLFGDSDDSNLGAEAVEAGELTDFPDFVDVDSDNVDNLVSGIDDGGKKKKGLLARFFDFLTEGDEDEESASLQLSDENREILNDLDKEKTAGKKKKKGKKAAKGGEKGDSKEGKGKPKKEKKPKKPKPEKPKKEKVPEPEPLIPERRLTLKRVLPVLLVCVSLAVLIIVFTNASVDFTEKQEAREAYYSGDYQTCFQNLYGKDLSESEQIMFGTSESILRVRLWLSEYEMFANADSELEALDVLIQAVDSYPKLYEYAIQWNAGDDVQAGYQQLLNILLEKYGLTESQALEIAGARSDIEYTKMVLFIVEGRGFGSWDDSQTVVDTSTVPEADSMPDALPEEDELSEGSFIDNQR